MAMTDAQWAALAPLVEACRPRSKRPPGDLRRTLEGILWRHRNGATWRHCRPSTAPSAAAVAAPALRDG